MRGVHRLLQFQHHDNYYYLLFGHFGFISSASPDQCTTRPQRLMEFHLDYYHAFLACHSIVDEHFPGVCKKIKPQAALEKFAVNPFIDSPIVSTYSITTTLF